MMEPKVDDKVRVKPEAFDAGDLLERERRIFAEHGYIGRITARIQHLHDTDRNWRVEAGDEYLYLTPDEFDIIAPPPAE